MYFIEPRPNAQREALCLPGRALNVYLGGHSEVLLDDHNEGQLRPGHDAGRHPAQSQAHERLDAVDVGELGEDLRQLQSEQAVELGGADVEDGFVELPRRASGINASQKRSLHV